MFYRTSLPIRSVEKAKYATKTCKTHGETEFVLEGRGYYRCKKCRMDRVAAQRRKNKLTLIREHGGRCIVCGYNRSPRALHFHHIDPTTKEFGLAHKSRGTRRIASLRAESLKCVLLCSNCHAEAEDGLIDGPWRNGSAEPC
jgi:hypothetical protein